MCRFVAYLGKQPILLSDVLADPSNSLIQQSRHALKLKMPVNADGFGLAWYQNSIAKTPGLFKSTQPAWNDLNLRHIANKIICKCFLGHVRASTIGNVSTSNCHPFAYEEFAFCHNGGIENFEIIKRELRESLNDKQYNNILGLTDSEHFFALLMNIYTSNKGKANFNNLLSGFEKATAQIIQLQEKHNIPVRAHLNTAITDGKQLMATRFSTDKELSLYYTAGKHLKSNNQGPVMELDINNPSAVLVASEPFGDYAADWLEVPKNHAIMINKNLEISIAEIQINKQ